MNIIRKSALTWDDEQRARKLSKIGYTVEASSEEQQCLWERFVDKHKVIKMTDWKQDSGYIETIGYLDNRPVVLTIWPVKVENFWVGFYECNSQVVDWKMIEEWLDKYCNPKDGETQLRTDAANFHNCLHYIRDRNKPQPQASPLREEWDDTNWTGVDEINGL